MNTSGKQILVFSCLLFICSFAHSGLSTEERFHLLSHYNNASLVEDGLTLATLSSGLATSTLINYGLLYSICQASKEVAALAGRQQVQSSFCNQLAAVLTSTEIALAGRVSPWPLTTSWWQPLRFVGTAYSGYVAYKTERDPYLIPIVAAAYFTSEVVTRTAAGGYAIWDSRYNNGSTIQPLVFARGEYSMLSSIAGSAVGVIVYDRMIAEGASRRAAVFAYLITFALVEKISSKSALLMNNPGSVDLVGKEAGAEDLAATGALAGSWATAITGTMIIVNSSDTMVGVATVAAVVLRSIQTAQWYMRSIQTARWYNRGAIDTGVVIGGLCIFHLKLQRLRLGSNDLSENIALTLAPALAIALINGVSNNLVYGYSIKESFTETVRIQWQKFYAPLDYLRTLLN
ncbi:hypothetical protein [Endozoicomonas sp. 4G]|uniref:hypothetical protein n=1 Tax=Endozoicomonas sp. 4G TaxID=2872754 RepID=UPI0020790B7B|nr:hypothetical protein [Endozoicomonas sp. 4G]